ncbi:glycoside hydrolase family 19 protein, partial [Flectobacillus roseus]|uniref:glycoside hydrolase family 19 protein n=1 Tax=Flectobacillus roseus TaxID=502259 RepID=UPI0036407648
KIDIQDTEAKEVKIDAVWKYLGGKAPEHQATFPITGAQLHEIFSSTPQERCDEVASIINKYSDKFEINTPLRMAHFLGQIGVESANLNAMGTKSGENPCYKKTNNAWTYDSAPGQGWIAKKRWSEPPIMEGCDDFTEDLKGKRKHPNWNSIDDVPKKFVCSTENPSSISGKVLFSYVYRCEGGNGDEASGDGFRYRGHGILQLTWKKQYIAFNEWLKKQGFLDDYKKVLSSPDEAFIDRDIDILSAMWYWDKEKCNEKAEQLNKGCSQTEFDVLTRKINKALLETSTRREYFELALKTIEK